MPVVHQDQQHSQVNKVHLKNDFSAIMSASACMYTLFYCAAVYLEALHRKSGCANTLHCFFSSCQGLQFCCLLHLLATPLLIGSHTLAIMCSHWPTALMTGSAQSCHWNLLTWALDVAILLSAAFRFCCDACLKNVVFGCVREDARQNVVTYSVSDKSRTSQLVVEDLFHEVLQFFLPVYPQHILLL